MTVSRSPGAGRPPTPTALKRLKGTDQPSRVRKDEPVPTDKPLSCPTVVSSFPLAKAWWDAILADSPPGMITTIDVAALMGFCLSTAYAIESAVMVKKDGVVIKNDKGEPIKSPFLSTFTEQMRLSKEFAVILGLTPTSRTRVSAITLDSTKPTAKTQPLRPIDKLVI